ncbi:MAG TPA: hypothetical protein VM389_03555, partial [Phycisphaerae bacterium]|nr:hypothetical protein [Phycisphaerae bacterium]
RQGAFFHLNAGKWTVITTVSGGFTAEVSAYMDLFYDAFTRALLPDGGLALPVKPTVVVFNFRPQYQRIRRALARGHVETEWDKDGRCLALTLYTFTNTKAERDFANFYHPVLLHEGAHLLLRGIVGNSPVPPWFDEGVATFFETWDLRAAVEKNLRPRFAASPRRKAFENVPKGWDARRPSLARLMAIEPKDWNPDRLGRKASYHYALAESFLDLLLTRQRGRELFHKILERITANGRAKAGAKEPVPLLTPSERARWEPLWHEHIARSLRKQDS